MSGLILTPSPDDSIALATHRDNPVRNHREFQVLPREKFEWNALKKKHPHVYQIRTEIIPYYNCHGLTFASRRTRIWLSDEVKKIVDEDNYEKVQLTDCWAGDVVLYESKLGEIEHSGIVVGPIRARNRSCKAEEVILLSKWGSGGEVVHKLLDCPYTGFNTTAWRIKEHHNDLSKAT